MTEGCGHYSLCFFKSLIPILASSNSEHLCNRTILLYPGYTFVAVLMLNFLLNQHSWQSTGSSVFSNLAFHQLNRCQSFLCGSLNEMSSVNQILFDYHSLFTAGFGFSGNIFFGTMDNCHAGLNCAASLHRACF